MKTNGVGYLLCRGELTLAFGLKVSGEPEHFFEGEVPVGVCFGDCGDG